MSSPPEEKVICHKINCTCHGCPRQKGERKIFDVLAASRFISQNVNKRLNMSRIKGERGEGVQGCVFVW